MHGFSSHTFSLIDAQGELCYLKWHIKTKQVIKNLMADLGCETQG